ncbi:hypothetical protein GMORB2_2687 [Geosmithia morbida]|uniref:Uncharacterized protein n=1 Tax=Geosmithia morbida TaxID=1094350 RepID=A0A9P4YRY3_9HYPO|nr:uncharacterized protein GMORB2_2687 [Geosmithia morbida]KAF4120684.1 hypothetical protein GMORB2_2687 [Geosmithia morbida]
MVIKIHPFGWGSLCVAGAGAYVFAKREINADRQSKMAEQRRRKEEQQQRTMDEYNNRTGGTSATPARLDTAASPSQEGNHDPAPTRHEPATEEQRIEEKGKYESSVPYRSRKGDRFS